VGHARSSRQLSGGFRGPVSGGAVSAGVELGVTSLRLRGEQLLLHPVQPRPLLLQHDQRIDPVSSGQRREMGGTQPSQLYEAGLHRRELVHHRLTQIDELTVTGEPDRADSDPRSLIEQAFERKRFALFCSGIPGQVLPNLASLAYLKHVSRN
jgi:hypothetical protein